MGLLQGHVERCRHHKLLFAFCMPRSHFERAACTSFEDLSQCFCIHLQVSWRQLKQKIMNNFADVWPQHSICLVVPAWLKEGFSSTVRAKLSCRYKIHADLGRLGRSIRSVPGEVVENHGADWDPAVKMGLAKKISNTIDTDAMRVHNTECVNIMTDTQNLTYGQRVNNSNQAHNLSEANEICAFS